MKISTETQVAAKQRPRLVYIAGPMTGIEKQNAPAFLATRDVLIKHGYQVIDPICVNMNFMGCAHPEDPTQNAPGLKADIIALTIIDGICLLPGWEHSRGARLEVAFAITLGITFIHWQTGNVVARPRQVTITHGYGEQESKGPGSHEDGQRALLQLVGAMPKIATGLSHAMGIILGQARTTADLEGIINKVSQHASWRVLMDNLAFTDAERDMIHRAIDRARKSK